MITSDKWLEPREQERLMQTLRIARYTDTRNALMIELALKCGARASELLALKKSDLIDDYEMVFITGVKGSRNRDVAINSDLYQRLREYAAGVDNLLFPISYKRYHQIWHEYTPNPSKGIHSLRHTFAILFYQKHKDVLKLKRVLGHVSIKNTMVYTEVEYDKEEKRKEAL